MRLTYSGKAADEVDIAGLIHLVDENVVLSFTDKKIVVWFCCGLRQPCVVPQ